MPDGKPAGVRCVHLNTQEQCELFGQPERPQCCIDLKPCEEMCGEHRSEALVYLTRLEKLTK